VYRIATKESSRHPSSDCCKPRRGNIMEARFTHKGHLKVCNNRRDRGTNEDRLSSLVIVNDFGQHEAVGIYPDEITLLCEKLLEVPEVKEVMISLLSNRKNIGVKQNE
jgi:hypothetical protein